MDILKLIENGENSKVEFKENINNSDSIAGEIVSFLNAEGGIIFFGISDIGEIKGVLDINIFEEKIANISRNNIFPEVILDFEIQNIQDKNLFVLKVPIGKNKPYEVKTTRKKYIRVQTTKREVSREEEVRLWQASGNLKYDNILIQESNIKEIDIKKVEIFIKKMYDKQINETGISYETLLQNLDICKKGIDDKLYPTFSGIYFFGKSEYIRRRINSSFIIFAFFKGNSIGGSEILDKKDIEGTFDEIYDNSIKILHKYNAEYKKIIGYKSEIKYDYPLEAIRETLINAMIHRDYTYTGANIRIFMFYDRLEIISPGVLPNGLTIEAINSGIYQRFTRNEYIINFASKFFSNIAESLGSGVNRIKEICKKGGYIEPKYLLTENELRVIYYKKPVANVGKPVANVGKPVANVGKPVANVGKPVANDGNLSQKQNEVYNFIFEKNFVNMNDLKNHFGVKRQTMLEHINILLAFNLIIKIGVGKSIIYKLRNIG